MKFVLPLATQPLAAASSLLLCCWLATQVCHTAQAAAADEVLEAVVVTAQRANLRKSLQAQEQASNIVSVVSSDDIGQFPDTNAAEALQRLPGLSVERDQGEGRYVSVRGLGADYNSVTINGALVPAPESARRGVMLDVLPAGLVRSLEVSKTLTPDRDANSLGGTIEVKTLSAFDLSGRLLSLDVGGTYAEITAQSAPKAGLLWADRFADGRFGVAAGFSYDQRKFGSDNVETGGAWEDDGQGDRLGEFERRDYLITRERQALSINLDYRPDEYNSWSLRGFDSRFSDDEQRNAQIIEFDAAQRVGQLGDAEVSRELKARKETQRIRSLVLAGQHRTDTWTVAAQLGDSRARETTPESIAAAAFAGVDSFADVGFANSRQPQLLGPSSLFDAASYALDEVELEANAARDRERHARLDVARQWRNGAFTTEFKFGAKASRRQKDNDTEVWVIGADDIGGDPALGSFAGKRVDYALGDFGLGIDPAAVRARLAGVARADFRAAEDSRVEDYTMNEDIDAAYLMATVDGPRWQLIAGLRNERTHFRAEGTGIDEGEFEAVQVTRRQHDWLPSLHLRFDLAPRTRLRAAVSKSVVRPSFAQLAPGFVIDGDEATFGNPSLQALQSTNLDAGIEHRLGDEGALSAYLFNKRIKHFTYQTDLAGAPGFTAFDEAITFVNGDAAKLSGVELAYWQALSLLPRPWNGLVLGANATFVDSRASISRFDADGGGFVSRRIGLPSQSDRVYNLSIGYEAGPISVRLAANRKSPYLLEVADVADASGDLFVASQTQLDFQLRYRFNKYLQINVEGLNLNDETYYVYQGNAARNAQYEQYGRSYKLTFNLNVF